MSVTSLVYFIIKILSEKNRVDFFFFFNLYISAQGEGKNRVAFDKYVWSILGKLTLSYGLVSNHCLGS